MKRDTIILAGLLLAGMLWGGCVASTPEVGTIFQRLQNEDPAVRIEAAVEAGKTRNSKALPLLVDRLSDTESEVRLFASLALEKIVGEKQFAELGWKFYDSPDVRQKAVEKWRQWLGSRPKP
ncbi:MAG: HEAT repeat domain-containing protein [Phycisphaerae bacterium]|nr:HEAT repeat domain-containing protein [Phycisphaerae bacterium]